MPIWYPLHIKADHEDGLARSDPAQRMEMKMAAQQVRTDARRERERKRDRILRDVKDESFLARKREAWERYASKPENRVKIRARNKVKHLCRVGAITRGPCEDCGDPKTHAHHHDYEKPLDVHWLCSRCHGLRHRPGN